MKARNPPRAPCRKGWTQDPVTRHCRKYPNLAGSMRTRLGMKCKAGKVRVTGRCVKRRGPNDRDRALWPVAATKAYNLYVAPARPGGAVLEGPLAPAPVALAPAAAAAAPRAVAPGGDAERQAAINRIIALIPSESLLLERVNRQFLADNGVPPTPYQLKQMKGLIRGMIFDARSAVFQHPGIPTVHAVNWREMGMAVPGEVKVKQEPGVRAKPLLKPRNR